MEIFINERSLSGQYELHSVTEGIRTFLAAVNTLNNCSAEKGIFTSRLFFDFQAISNTYLGSILSASPELRGTFFSNIKNARKWEDNRVHPVTSTYLYNRTDYVNSSIAELAERKIAQADLKGMLINFTDSTFAELVKIAITKDSSINVILDCSYDEDSVTLWLIDNGFIDPKAVYSAIATFPPKDYQTILLKSGLFELTGLRNQNRKVYKKIDAEEYWVVDNMHRGNDAHIEVFSSRSRLHLGTSPIHEVRLEPQYKVNGRTLN